MAERHSRKAELADMAARVASSVAEGVAESASSALVSMLQGARGFHGVEYRFWTAGAPSARWRVRRARWHERLSENYALRLELSSTQGDDATQLLGKACTLTLLREDSVRYVQGLVSRVSRGELLREVDVIEVDVVPALEALTHRTDTRIFQDKTIPEVLDLVIAQGLGPYGRRHRAELSRSVYPRREYIVQYRESDLDFVRRLMAEEGLWYRFEHPSGDGEAEVLVIADENDAAPPAELGPAGDNLRLALSRAGGADREVAKRFVRMDAIASTGLTVRAYDWTTPPVAQQKTVPREDAGERPLYEPDDLTLWEYGSPKYGKFDTNEQARLRWEQRQAAATRARGTSNFLGLCPGTVVCVEGHPTGLNGEWLVVSVDAHGQYLRDDPKSGESADDYANEFTCIPKSVAFRPPLGPKPRVQGVQTAIVVGADGSSEVPANGDDIHTDEHGRVQVKPSWDRSDPRSAEGTETCWLRVAQPWGGQGWGVMFIPRIGMEVIVSFVDGDPDRPLVTGCVYNGLNRPAYELPAEKTKSYIMTQSTPNGGGFNELCFDDAKGNEEIYVHAQKDYNEVVENDHTLKVRANQKYTVDKNQRISVGADRTKTVSGNETTVVKEDRTETVHGKDTLRVADGSDRSVEVSGHEKKTVEKTRTLEVRDSTTERHLNGRTITVSAHDVLKVVDGANKSEHVTGQYNITADQQFKVAQGEDQLLIKDQLYAESAGAVQLKNKGFHLNAAPDGKTTITVGSELTIKVGGASVTLKANGTIEVSAAKTATISAPGGSFEASAQGVTATGTKATLSGTALTEVKGAIVKLN